MVRTKQCIAHPAITIHRADTKTGELQWMQQEIADREADRLFMGAAG